MFVAVSGDVCMKHALPPRCLRVPIELVPLADEFVPTPAWGTHRRKMTANSPLERRGGQDGLVGTGFVPPGNEIVPDIALFGALGPSWSTLCALREICR